MAAPIGNQFWKLVENPTGRPKEYATPGDLWDKAAEYFQWCDSNPLMSYEWNGKDPVKCELEKMRAYTIKGLCLFLGIYESTFHTYTTAETHKEFHYIASHIRDIIYTQKFEGAAAGMLNPNIIARDLGLVDKTDSNHTGIPPANNDVLLELVKKINAAASG